MTNAVNVTIERCRLEHLGGSAMSNYPLRGGKAELWEGGVRGACFLYGGALPAAASGHRSDTLLSAMDWFPTILSLAANLLPNLSCRAM